MSRWSCENLRTVAFGDIDSIYTRIGTSFEYPTRNFLLQNFTDQLLYYSDDGVNDKWVLPSQGQLIIDITTNRSDHDSTYYSSGIQLYVKYPDVAPTSGATYLTTFYGYNGHTTGGSI